MKIYKSTVGFSRIIHTQSNENFLGNRYVFSLEKNHFPSTYKLDQFFSFSCKYRPFSVYFYPLIHCFYCGVGRSAFSFSFTSFSIIFTWKKRKILKFWKCSDFLAKFAWKDAVLHSVHDEIMKYIIQKFVEK